MLALKRVAGSALPIFCSRTKINVQNSKSVYAVTRVAKMPIVAELDVSVIVELFIAWASAAFLTAIEIRSIALRLALRVQMSSLFFIFRIANARPSVWCQTV